MNALEVQLPPNISVEEARLLLMVRVSFILKIVNALLVKFSYTVLYSVLL